MEKRNHGLLWCYRILRWFLGGAFVFAGVTKSLNFEKFAETISEFGLVFEGTESATAIILAGCEIVVGIGLLFDIKGSLSAVFLLVMTFLAVLSYGLWLGLDIDCGCFGDNVVKFTTGLQDALWKDIVFLIIVVGIFTLRKTLGISPRSIWNVSARREEIAQQSTDPGG